MKNILFILLLTPCLIFSQVSGCTDTILANFTISNESTSGASDGQIDLTVSGGSCQDSVVQVGSGTVPHHQSFLWFTFRMDGYTEITYPAAELAALGMTSGQVITELSWKILQQTVSASTTPMTNANLTVNGINVWSGTHQAILGLNTFVFNTPIVYNGGDLVVEWCFDNSSRAWGDNRFESTIIGGTLSDFADYPSASGCTALTASTARTYRPNLYLGFPPNKYNWSNGDTTEDISNITSGVYCVSITDCNGCTATFCDTVHVTCVNNTISANFTIGNESTSGASDGQIDLTVSGVMCQDSVVQVGSGTVPHHQSFLWFTFRMDGYTEITYPAAELAALGMTSGQVITELSWKILQQTVSASTTPMTNANLTVNGINVWSGTHQAILGLNTFVFNTPIVYNGGDLVVEWCFDNSSRAWGDNRFESTIIGGTLSDFADYPSASGCTALTASTARTYRPNLYLGFPPNKYNWSNGDTTEDISNITSGVYCVSITDCNGCTATFCDTVITAPQYGCTDTLAFNYNSFANTDDGSCLYSGCTDTLACNYDSLSSIDDGSCTFATSGYDCAGNCLNGGTITTIINKGIYSQNSTVSLVGIGGVWSLTDLATGAILAGTHNGDQVTLCLPDGCYEITGDSYNSSTPYGFSINGGAYVRPGGNPHLTYNTGGTAQFGIGASFVLDTAGLCSYVAPVLGCMNWTACNYDPLANTNDGSCIFGTPAPLCEYFSSGNPPQATCPTPITGGLSNYLSYEWQTNEDDGDGWRFSGSPGHYASTSAGNNRASGTFAWVDFSGLDNGARLIMEPVNISALASPTLTFAYFSDPGLATLQTPNRIIVEAWDGNNISPSWSVVQRFEEFTSGWAYKVLDISAYQYNYGPDTGLVKLRFRAESSRNENEDYKNDLCIDDVCIAESPSISLIGCTDPLACNYDTNVIYDDGSCYFFTGSVSVSTNDISCNGLTDGSATVSANTSVASYAWSNGDSTATTIGLATGTYTCVIADTNGCVNNVSATIVEPSEMTLNMLVGNESTPGAFDGQIDLLASGGVACIVNDSLSTHNTAHTSNGSSGIHFNIVNNSTYPLTINGFSQGSYSYSGMNNMNVYYMPAPYVVTPTGWTQVATTVPVTIPVGGTFATPVYSTTIPIIPVTIPVGSTYGFYVGGTSTVSYATATASGPVGSVVASNALISVTSGVGGTFGSGTFSPRAPVVQVHFQVSGVTPYTYLWSTGDTTEDITGLTSHQYCVTVTDCNGCQVSLCDSVGISAILGCTDSLASNYDPLATADDGSCTYTSSCSSPSITSLGVSNVIHDRATLTFDDMNSSSCRVDQLRIKYREVGTNAWSQKNMGSPTGYDPVTGICNSTSRTDKLLLGLSSNTTYEWQMRVWYCSTGNTPWVNGPNFTTLADCPNVGNLAVTTPNSTKATFTWDDSNGPYSFVRLQGRVDTVGSSFFNIGGVGVPYGTYTKNKNGLVPGTSYRAKSRTWCDPNGGAYKAPSWTSFIYFTMPVSIKLEQSTVINDLDIYPNPSRDVFNISFNTINKQDITLRIRNIIGEEIYTEKLREFNGAYTKAISLENYPKAVYFLEINTNKGSINKKLLLQ